MSRIMGVVVALATAAAVLTGSTAGGAPPAAPASTADLPRETPDGVEVTLADGDTFRVWTSENYRTVRSKRRDAATGTWGEPQVVLRVDGLFCGDVDARTANGAVALIAQCDTGGYSEDQAPTASRALWSADTLTWSSYELEGEAYDEPGISPDGTNAVWPEREGYVTRTEAGFVRRLLDTRDIEYTATATISDTELVSYLYGGNVAPRRCALIVLTRTGDAMPVRQELPLDSACQDANFANVDSDTTWFGDFTDPGHVTVISRPDATSPWAVTAIAPAAAPGLVSADGTLSTRFFTAPGRPLFAVGSAGGRVVRAQAYDPISQTWGPSTSVHDAGAGRTCRWGDNRVDPPLEVIAVNLRCGSGHVVLTATDGVTWRALRMRQNTWGFSPDGRHVAVPARTVTHLISAERGVVTLPGGVRGRCDVVVPDGPDAAVLLTAARGDRGWPTILRQSSANGWQGRTRTHLPTPSPTCRDARTTAYDPPYRFSIFSRFKGYHVRIVERAGEWTVRRSRY